MKKDSMKSIWLPINIFFKENKKIIKVFLVAGAILCPADMAMKYMHGDNLHEHCSTVHLDNKQASIHPKQ